jgi:hypothetical protein
MKPAVDLVINTFERTYRDVLKPGFFVDIEAQNRFTFARKIALINNVHDRKDAVVRAQELVQAGEISAFHFVDENLDHALAVTSLTRNDLGRIPHYSDYLLVAITLEGASWLLHWDAEVHLRNPINWIEPAVKLMEDDPRVLVANPNWWRPGLERETTEISGEFALGFGFSDAVFLARRVEFAGPIYKRFCPASLRYQLIHIRPYFEPWVDAYMRSTPRLRATYTKAVYVHPENEGATYPDASIVESLRKFRNGAVVRALKLLPSSHPCWRV